MSDITQQDGLGTGQFVASLLTIEQQPEWMSAQAFDAYRQITAVQWMPTMIFIIAAFVAF
ncbi:MAG: hypothetical protein GTO41_20540, partial [Burkholderiales bacterium]|nr:hypothetical protein [Burkholderiales bacterium]